MITFSGCPGGDPQAAQPNWIVSPWPPEFSEMLDWQWKRARRCPTGTTPRKIVQAGRRASRHRDASELRRLQSRDDAAAARHRAEARSAATSIRATCSGRRSTCIPAIRALGDSIFHVHAKDCRIDAANVALNGVLDAKNYTEGVRTLLDLPHRRLWQRRDRLEGHRLEPAHGRLRSRAQHRARRQPDVRRRRTEKQSPSSSRS